MRPRVYISVTGPDNNFGDFFIRREALRWTATADSRSVFVGNHDDAWIAAAGVDQADTVVRGGASHRLRWLLSAAVTRRRPILVTDPGEVWLGRSRFVHQLFHLLVAWVIVLRGGKVIIPPHAIAQQRAATIWYPTLRVHRALAKISEVCLWREPWSMTQVGTGSLAPDIAFSAMPSAETEQIARHLCLVSLRGDRDRPSENFLQAVSAVAERAGFEIVTFAQVDRDAQVAATIAQSIGAHHDTRPLWRPEAEAELRDLFDRSALIISDRLHVLVLGALAGAIPLEIVANPEAKVRAHFSAIGLDGISLNATQYGSEEISDWISTQLTRRHAIQDAVQKAHASLTQWSRLVQRLVSA